MPLFFVDAEIGVEPMSGVPNSEKCWQVLWTRIICISRSAVKLLRDVPTYCGYPRLPQSQFRCRGEPALFLRSGNQSRRVWINALPHHGIAPCFLRRVAGVSLDTCATGSVRPASVHRTARVVSSTGGSTRFGAAPTPGALDTNRRRLLAWMCRAATHFVELGGLEPPPTEPKSVVLPLHQSSICGSGGTRTRSPLIKSQVQCHFATDPMWAGKDLNLRTRMGADWQCGKLRISETSLFTLRFNV